jgi:anthranilate synthase component 1
MCESGVAMDGLMPRSTGMWVSAYLKLKAMRPRFLLESVEGGERLARYSFLGFGDAVEVRMDRSVLRINGEVHPRPQDQHEYLDSLRRVLAFAPRPKPEDDLPFAGGLVGVSGYDVVRLFERLPQDTEPQTSVPDAAFVAPSSLLVFDHLTRRVALLHDGPESERQRLRAEVIRQLRGPIPATERDVSIAPAEASLTEQEYADRVEACKEYIAAKPMSRRSRSTARCAC